MFLPLKVNKSTYFFQVSAAVFPYEAAAQLCGGELPEYIQKVAYIDMHLTNFILFTFHATEKIIFGNFSALHSNMPRQNTFHAAEKIILGNFSALHSNMSRQNTSLRCLVLSLWSTRQSTLWKETTSLHCRRMVVYI